MVFWRYQRLNSLFELGWSRFLVWLPADQDADALPKKVALALFY
jgi:hypothetical protein